MKRTKVRVGIVGLGIGRWHLESFRSLDNAEVVALCDVNAEKLAKTAAEFNIAKTYADYNAMVNARDIDAVSVCVPNYLHRPIAVAALKAGKHVLCEKPLSVSVRDGEAILEASRKSGTVAMVAMKFRFRKQSDYIHRQLESGKLGEVYYGFNSYIRPVGGIPGGWFVRKKLSGGGALLDNGVHLLDVNWWLMGCPKPVAAFGATYAKFGPFGKGIAPADAKEFDVDDFAVGVIRFANGASVMIENGWAAHVEKEMIAVRVLGTRGGGSMYPFAVTFEKAGKSVSTTPDLDKEKEPSQFAHFCRCIQKGLKPISPIEQGVTMLKMLDALYRSSESRRSIAIK